jgi:RNA polymerase sigma factor (sigma-70 family)
LAESRSGTGPLVILVGGAPSLSSQPRLVPTAICVTFSATARRTGDCAARSPGASRKQAPSEVAGGRGGPVRQRCRRWSRRPSSLHREQVAARNAGGDPGRSPDHRFLVQPSGSNNLSTRTGCSRSAGERKGGLNVVTESSHEFGEFVRGHRETLRKLAFWMCGDWHASEDVVQDALVAIHRRWPGLDNAGRISYARTVVAHLVIRELGRRGRLKEDPRDEEAGACEEDQWVDRVTVRDAVAHLSARQQEIVMLRFWNALSTGEIADRLSMPAGTVRSDLTRAYATLRMLLQDSFPSPDVNGHAEVPAGSQLEAPSSSGPRPGSSGGVAEHARQHVRAGLVIYAARS